MLFRSDIADAIKTARELALLPYTQRTVTEKRGRGGRGDRDSRGPRSSERDYNDVTEESVVEDDVVDAGAEGGEE